MKDLRMETYSQRNVQVAGFGKLTRKSPVSGESSIHIIKDFGIHKGKPLQGMQ